MDRIKSDKKENISCKSKSNSSEADEESLIFLESPEHVEIIRDDEFISTKPAITSF